MPVEIDIGNQLTSTLFSALKSLPWYFWAMIVIVLVIKMLPPPQQRRRAHCVQSISQHPHNGKIMPCPDCKGKVSINATTCPHCGAPIPITYVEAFKAKQDQAMRISANDAVSCSIIFSNVFAMAAIALVLLLIIHFMSGWLMWTLAVFFGLVLIAGLIEFVKLWNKGTFGEQIIHTILSKELPKEEYRVIDDVFLPVGESGTTQIDHIVVSVYGVFVVETKNYTGWIFGDANSSSWTQVLGERKSQFQNPIRQNYLHVCALADNLGLPKEIIHGIVAFSDNSEFKTVMPEGVVFFT